MSSQKRQFASPLLSIGIAMIALVFAFTFSSEGIQWLWHSEPHISVLIGVVGFSMIVAHLAMRARRRASS